MKPYFSVLIPTYNRERHVCEAIDSLLAQTWTDFEILVVDDGSTDGTERAFARYGSRIRVIRQLNQGPEVARNKAALQARGDYLVFLDSDDLLFPQALETYSKVAHVFNEPPLIVASMMYFVDGNPPRITGARNVAEIRALKFADYLSKDIPIGLSNSRIVILKSVFDAIGGLRQSTPATFHLDDFNLILKAGTQGPCIVVVQPDTVAYREHATNSIRDPTAMVDGILSIVASEKRGEYPGGKRRRWERWACIGGIAQRWVQRSFLAGYPRQALRMLFGTLPMLVAAIGRKLKLSLRRKTPAIAIGSTPGVREEDREEVNEDVKT